MKNSCVLLLTISIGMFLSLGSASPTTGITAETQPMQAHHLQRRAVIFRPLFVYRQQELSKQKKREESLQDRLDYQQQLAEHQRLMKEYEKQLREYEQRQQQQKQHHGHHHH
ncbi:splicing factor 3B subunit 4 [Sabethes cyaneus]|uniref:splicing factor 3B subunit 4 n=1 Tax=Sabethes cyaneus TaxID=53552 RepID=UPI00237E2502|nr:splicing factor 3B subunit 4 [Sabethes cyaneus]